MTPTLCCLLSLWLPTAPEAEPPAEPLPLLTHPWRVRAYGALSAAQNSNPDGVRLGSTGGIKLVLPANRRQSFGVSVEYLQTDDRAERRYVATGIHLEQRWFDVLLTSVDARGAIPTEGGPVPFLMTTRIGWSPAWTGSINPIVAFRSDWLFDDDIQTMSGIELALEWQFRLSD